MLVDILKNGFSLTELTQAINIMPNMYQRVGELNLFTPRPLSTPNLQIEQMNGILKLVQTSPWGAPAPKAQLGKRSLRSFVVPHTPLEDTVKAADLVGIRAFGTENQAATVASAVNDKLQNMKNWIDQTMQWRQMSALKGIVLDADGTTVLYNYFTEFGITPQVFNFQLNSAATDVRGKCMELARYMEDNLLGDRMTGIHVLVSQEFFDDLVAHPNVEKAYLNYAEAAQRIGGDLRKGFTFGGITFEEYRGLVNGQRFVDAGEGHAFPLGTIETFSNYMAPADFIETVNTRAQAYYARQRNTDFARGVDLHVQSNQLPLVTRPALVPTLTAA